MNSNINDKTSALPVLAFFLGCGLFACFGKSSNKTPVWFSLKCIEIKLCGCGFQQGQVLGTRMSVQSHVSVTADDVCRARLIAVDFGLHTLRNNSLAFECTRFAIRAETT